jgi:NitT/TauT family transport system permease protein
MMLRWVLQSPLPALILLALLWWLAVPALRIQPRYLPPLASVVADAASVWPDLVAGFWRTLIETLAGFALGSALGVLCGVSFAHSRWLEDGVFPLFVALQSVPVIAFGAIVVIWFGNTILAKVVIAMYLAFFPVTVNTLRGLQETDPQRLALMRSFGASPAQLFFKLKLPTALPTIMVGLKVAVSLSLAGAIVGEWFGDTVGLGVMLLQALYFEQVPRLWALIIASATMGALLYGGVALLERRLVWWRAR